MVTKYMIGRFENRAHVYTSMTIGHDSFFSVPQLLIMFAIFWPANSSCNMEAIHIKGTAKHV